jgi:hypothetical protein
LRLPDAILIGYSENTWNNLAVGVFVFIGFFIMPALASDRFVDHGDGTVSDTKTDLMWTVKDNGSPINWPNAI